MEYSEQLNARYNDSFFDKLISAFINLPDVSVFDPTYKWKLIESDPDDDKFVDCAVAANADFIVTNDKHFKVLKHVNFPSVNVLNADEFIAVLKNI